MTLKLISKHRTCLMALAMIWIGFNHSYFPFHFKIFSFISKCGYGGVDMFAFLSGFGLYYACQKHRSYKEYIKRRLLRILPYNIVAVIIGIFIYDEPLKLVIYDCLGLSIIFRTNLLYWFTSFIMIVYILYPLYYYFFCKKPYLTSLVSVVIVSIICLCITDPLDYYRVYEIFRIIPLILGTLFAYFNDTKQVNKIWCYILVVLMFVGWFLMYYMYHNFGSDIQHIAPLPLIIPGLVIFLSFVIDKIKFIQKPLEFIGQYSFQFYLVHEKLLTVLNNHYGDFYISGIGFDWWINIIGFVGAFLIAIVFKKIVDNVMSVIMKKMEGANE